jgi:hypothetical protein
LKQLLWTFKPFQIILILFHHDQKNSLIGGLSICWDKGVTKGCSQLKMSPLNPSSGASSTGRLASLIPIGMAGHKKITWLLFLVTEYAIIKVFLLVISAKSI